MAGNLWDDLANWVNYYAPWLDDQEWWDAVHEGMYDALSAVATCIPGGFSIDMRYWENNWEGYPGAFTVLDNMTEWESPWGTTYYFDW